MNYADWYTDTMDIYRVVKSMQGNLTKQSREQVGEAIPCRVYLSSDRPMQARREAASTEQTLMLACDNAVDIQPGDELIIHRGAVLGRNDPDLRVFASDPTNYYEPFGAVIPGLAHKQVMLHEEERNK